MKICKDYVGIVCVDGNCPKALHDEYAERGMDCIKSCEDCWFYKGCEDCLFDELLNGLNLCSHKKDFAEHTNFSLN